MTMIKIVICLILFLCCSASDIPSVADLIKPLNPDNFSQLWTTQFTDTITAEYAKDKTEVWELLNNKFDYFEALRNKKSNVMMLVKNIGGGVAFAGLISLPLLLFNVWGIERHDREMKNSKNVVEYGFNFLSGLTYTIPLIFVPIMRGIGATAGGIKTCKQIYSKYQYNARIDSILRTILHFEDVLLRINSPFGKTFNCKNFC
jgi:hypothetical protein